MNSVPCERIFSKMGIIVTKRRSSLCSSKAGLICYVGINSHFAPGSTTRQDKIEARKKDIAAMQKEALVISVSSSQLMTVTRTPPPSIEEPAGPSNATSIHHYATPSSFDVPAPTRNNPNGVGITFYRPRASNRGKAVAVGRQRATTAASSRDQRSFPTPESTEEDEFVLSDSDSRDSERPVRSKRRRSNRAKGSSASRGSRPASRPGSRPRGRPRKRV